MSAKSQKRLVNKGRYVWLMTGRVTLLSVSLGCVIFGILFLFETLTFWLYVGDVAALACVFVAAGLFFLATRMYAREQKIERVEVVTNRTSYLLPPEESLVRASNLPPTQQQAELLRAAQYGNETPAEELLRATQENRQDV